METTSELVAERPKGSASESPVHRCETCGRFLKHVRFELFGMIIEDYWRCTKVFYDDYNGGWEHH